MEKFLEQIKEGCKKNKTELLLMALFLCLLGFLCAPEIARETVAEGNLLEEYLPEEIPVETETEFQSEWVEPETEEPELTQEEKDFASRRALSKLGNNFYIPMRMPEIDEEDSKQGFCLSDSKILRGMEVLLPETLERNGLLPEGLEWVKGIFDEENKSLGTLEKMLTNKIANYEGIWSVYVKNLGTDESFVINDQPMKSASVMKLFIMGTVYEAFESGDLERTDDIMNLVYNMITYSDNSASNQLLYRLGESSYERGIAKVDDFIRTHGFSEMTIEYNGFNDPATNTSSEHYNQVAAKDCGKLLEDIYRRTWMDRSVSNEMEELLLSQNTRYKIPAGLPDSVLCGNKTGEMDATENDAAIIYGEDCDYILVVLSNGWSSKDAALERICSISSTVYEFLND